MKYLFILGNGFSLDLVHHLNTFKNIPLNNLFEYGDKLDWPTDGNHAFVSFRNTPNLWILGARPSNPPEKNNQIIENILTCANSYYLKESNKRSFGQSDKRSIYINAYRELVVYLKYLFVYFDSKISFDCNDIGNWAWTKLLRSLNQQENVERINIITYNYDVWLERVLESLGIEYHISGMSSQNQEKFSITKPHGSISFIHKKPLDPAAFSINYDSDYLEGDITDFEVRMADLNQNTPIIPIIPPAGDSDRFNLTWAGVLRKDAAKKAEALKTGDRVILCGLSYWHVDRREIDDLLLKISDTVELAFINPAPPETFDAVLTSLFTQYEHYTSIGNYIGDKYDA